MNTQDIIEKIGLNSHSKFEPREVDGVITVQTHKSVVPAANLVDVAAVVVAGGKDVPQDTIDLATKHDIAVLSTDLSTFELVGKLYALGITK